MNNSAFVDKLTEKEKNPINGRVMELIKRAGGEIQIT